MPILDPGQRVPEVVQAVDLSAEHPTVDQVKLDVQTPVIGVKAFFANGSLVAPAFSFTIVAVVTAGIGYVTNDFASSAIAALIAMAVVFASGLAFVDRWRGK